MDFTKNKKGAMDLAALAPAAIAFVFVAIVLTIGGDVVSNVEAGQTAGSAAENASLFGLQSIQELSSWLPTIALVVAAAVVIGVLAYFRG